MCCISCRGTCVSSEACVTWHMQNVGVFYMMRDASILSIDRACVKCHEDIECREFPRRGGRKVPQIIMPLPGICMHRSWDDQVRARRKRPAYKVMSNRITRAGDSWRSHEGSEDNRQATRIHEDTGQWILGRDRPKRTSDIFSRCRTQQSKCSDKLLSQVVISILLWVFGW